MNPSGRFDFADPKGYCPEGECSGGIGYAVFIQRGAVEAQRLGQPDLQKIDGCDCLRDRLRFHELPLRRSLNGAVELLAEALCWDGIAALAFWQDVRDGSAWARPQVENLALGLGVVTANPDLEAARLDGAERARRAIDAVHALATGSHARAVADLHDDPRT